MVVATGNNAARIAMSVERAAKGLIKGGKVTEGLLNKIEMAFRAYDPCLGCATHSLPGPPAAAREHLRPPAKPRAAARAVLRSGPAQPIGCRPRFKGSQNQAFIACRHVGVDPNTGN